MICERSPIGPLSLFKAPAAWLVMVLPLLLYGGTAVATELPELGTADPRAVDEVPDIRIIRRDDITIEEHRIGGQLYMIRVIPRHGTPYYLIDTDGDGRLESRHIEIAEDMMIPAWTLFRW